MKFLKYALLALSLLLVPPAYGWDQIEMNKTIDATNFLVNDGCSGTLISKDGKILTAAHCIIDRYRTVEKDVVKEDGTIKKEKFQISVPGDVSQLIYSGPAISQVNKFIYKIVKTDRALDLALLEVKANFNNFAPLACREVTRGDTVYAVGNSFGVLYSTLTTGIVSNTARSYRDLGISGELGDTTDTGEHGLIQHSATIAGGNSGGALYNNEGALVGVNVRGRPGGFSFSVPLVDVREFLKNDIESPC